VVAVRALHGFHVVGELPPAVLRLVGERPRLAEQPRALQDDRTVVGEGSEQGNLVGVKHRLGPRRDEQRADDVLAGDQRHADG